MNHLSKNLLRNIFVVFLLPILLCTFASASVLSSANLNSYRATITPRSSGKIIVTADVTGVGYQKEIGVSSVYLYESTDGSSFTRVASYESDDYPELMRYNTSYYYRDVATYQGVAGRYYYASVYVYASDGETSDTKNYTTSIKQAIK